MRQSIEASKGYCGKGTTDHGHSGSVAMPVVESIHGKVSSAWVFKDARMPVSIVFENLEAEASISEIMEWFDLSREQIVAVIDFAALSLEAPPPSQQFAQAVDADAV